MQNRWVKIAIIVACTLLGALLAATAPAWLADPARQRAASVAAAPLGTLLGLLLVRAAGAGVRLGMAAVACGCGYFWSLFLAASLERRLVGPVFGAPQQHRVYFSLVLVFQILAGVAVAVAATGSPESPAGDEPDPA